MPGNRFRIYPRNPDMSVEDPHLLAQPAIPLQKLARDANCKASVPVLKCQQLTLEREQRVLSSHRLS